MDCDQNSNTNRHEMGGRRRARDVPDERSRKKRCLRSDGAVTASQVFELPARSTEQSDDCSVKSLSNSPSPASSHGISLQASRRASKEFTIDDSMSYEACFGRIDMSATIDSSVVFASDICVEVTGSLLKLSRKDSKKHVGLLMSSALSDITRNHRVTLTATLEPMKRQGVKVMNMHETHIKRPIRVYVYGFFSEKNQVARALSERDLYLQDPYIGEIDPGVPYNNPQYLPRPGGSMPEIERLEISSIIESKAVKDTLRESEKSQLLRIFQSEDSNADVEEIHASPRILTPLKPHQLFALAFMVDKEITHPQVSKFPTLWRKVKEDDEHESYHHVITGQRQQGYPTVQSGGVLADEMGLGKTLTTLSLICWYLDVIDNKRGDALTAVDTRQTLVVAPKSAIYQWQKQVEKHINPGGLRLLVYHGPNRRNVVKLWKSQDLVLTTYDTVRSEFDANGPILRHSWARVILDEAHTIRNRASKLFQAVCTLKSQSRWCLTGTPIHNRLDDFGALLSFLGISPFSTRKDFEQWIGRPIRMKKPYALQTLRKLVLATCLRRTKLSNVGTLALPHKTEKVEALTLNEEERKLYKFFQRRAVSLCLDSDGVFNSGRQQGILPLIGILRLICDHGHQLLPETAISVWRKRKEPRIDWSIISSMGDTCLNCGMVVIDDGDTGLIDRPCSQVVCAICGNTNRGHVVKSPVERPCAKSHEKEGGFASLSTANPKTPFRKDQYKSSTKVKALLRNLRAELCQSPDQEQAKPFKSVVFSYWTKMLDLVQVQFESCGLSFTRIDGQTSLPNRMEALEVFNNDPHCQILLASIGSVGEGVDLTDANHVHILEPQWNPMTEAQAIDRIHRIGQKRDVFITRYCVENSIEDYVRWVQKEKLMLIEQTLSDSDPQQSQVEELRWKKLLEALH